MKSQSLQKEDTARRHNSARAGVTQRLLGDMLIVMFVGLIAEAKQLGADAIVAVRFVRAPVMQGAAELLAYATAVKLDKTRK